MVFYLAISITPHQKIITQGFLLSLQQPLQRHWQLQPILNRKTVFLEIPMLQKEYLGSSFPKMYNKHRFTLPLTQKKVKIFILLLEEMFTNFRKKNELVNELCRLLMWGQDADQKVRKTYLMEYQQDQSSLVMGNLRTIVFVILFFFSHLQAETPSPPTEVSIQSTGRHEEFSSRKMQEEIGEFFLGVCFFLTRYSLLWAEMIALALEQLILRSSEACLMERLSITIFLTNFCLSSSVSLAYLRFSGPFSTIVSEF